MRTSSWTGLTVPSTFETQATAIIRVRSVIRSTKASRISSPASFTGAATTLAPVASAAICQGTMLAWCSISVTRISSPGCSRGRQKAGGDEIDRLGGVAGEHDLAPVGGVDEPLHLAPGGIVRGGRALAEIVDAAMDVGVVVLVEVLERVDHRARLLSAGRRVEIDQRPVVHPGGEDREVAPYPRRRRSPPAPRARRPRSRQLLQVGAARQARDRRLADMLAHRRVGEPLDHLGGEGEGQHALGRGARQAARAEIEQRRRDRDRRRWRRGCTSRRRRRSRARAWCRSRRRPTAADCRSSGRRWSSARPGGR